MAGFRQNVTGFMDLISLFDFYSYQSKSVSELGDPVEVTTPQLMEDIIFT